MAYVTSTTPHFVYPNLAGGVSQIQTLSLKPLAHCWEETSLWKKTKVLEKGTVWQTHHGTPGLVLCSWVICLLHQPGIIKGHIAYTGTQQTLCDRVTPLCVTWKTFASLAAAAASEERNANKVCAQENKMCRLFWEDLNRACRKVSKLTCENCTTLLLLGQQDQIEFWEFDQFVSRGDNRRQSTCMPLLFPLWQGPCHVKWTGTEKEHIQATKNPQSLDMCSALPTQEESLGALCELGKGWSMRKRL